MPRPRQTVGASSLKVGCINMLPSVRFLQYALLAAIVALFLALTFYQFTRPQGINTVVLCLQSIPLLIVLPGIIKLQRRSFQWCGFIILIYFMRSVIGVFSPAMQWIDITQLVLSIAMFFIGLLGSRQLGATSTISH